MDSFKPSIIGSCGNSCICSGADIGGIRLMCSGAVAPLHILEAFEPEATGAFVGGYHWNRYQ
jgi:coenzyme F420-reducing hydrogenase delta subunit